MMKNTALFLTLLIGLAACAAPQELIVNIYKDKANDALRAANQRGVTIGYALRRNDIDRGFSLLNFNDVSSPVSSNFNIKVTIQKEEEPYSLKLTGQDDGDNRDDKTVLEHMESMALDVKECCGLAQEEEEAEEDY